MQLPFGPPSLMFSQHRGSVLARVEHVRLAGRPLRRLDVSLRARDGPTIRGDHKDAIR